MEDIQILFFSCMITANVLIYFYLIWKQRDRDKKVKEMQEQQVRITDFCNTLFDKIKEVVTKVNPLLAAYDDGSDKTEIYDVEETNVAEDGREFPKSSLHEKVMAQMGKKNEE